MSLLWRDIFNTAVLMYFVVPTYEICDPASRVLVNNSGHFNLLTSRIESATDHRWMSGNPPFFNEDGFNRSLQHLV